MRVLALVVGVAAVIASWYFAEEFALDLLIFSAYLFSPYALLAFGARGLGPVARAVAIFLIAAMTVGMYEEIWTDDSSTAALGFVVLPGYQLLAIAAIAVFQGVRPWHWRGSPLRRIGATRRQSGAAPFDEGSTLSRVVGLTTASRRDRQHLPRRQNSPDGLAVMRIARSTARALVLSGAPVVLSLAVAACGGSDERRDRERIEQVTADSISAAHAGDRAKACSHYTPGYVRELFRENGGLRPKGASCAEVLRSFEGILKQLTSDPKPHVTDIEVRGAKATARLEIETHLGPAASKLFLTREDGDWKIDHDRDLSDDTPSPGAGL